MLKYITNNKSSVIFILVSMLLFSLMLILENINGRFESNDFRVMYSAADSLLNGKTVYGIPFGLSSGYYKYSPFVAMLFVPYTLFGFKIASIIHFTFTAISGIAAIIILENLLDKYVILRGKRRLITLFLILLAILLHIVKDLHLGNTNTILIFLLILTLKLNFNKKYLLSGLLFALIVFTKPYFAILALPFILYSYKTVVYSIFSGLTFLLFTVLIFGFQQSLQLHLEWINAMLEHSNYIKSSYTIFYLLDYYLGISIPVKYSYFVLIVISLVAYLFFFLSKRKNIIISQFNKEQSLLFFYFLLIAIIPNVLITDNEHFIFSLPLIGILILYLRKTMNYPLIILFAIILFMYGGNSTDLVGKILTLKIKFWGWLGISNLLIIAFTMLLFYYRKTELYFLKNKF